MLGTDSPVLHGTLDLARRIDRAESDICALGGGIGVLGGAASLEAGGGRALFSRPGSPLNKVLGIGLHGPVSDEELDAIERFYRDRGSPAQIELCPLAYADLPARLCARGFVVQGFESQLARRLEPPPGGEDASVAITLVTPEQDDLWNRMIAEGFAAAEAHVGGAPPQDAFNIDQLVEVMSQFNHQSISRYLAWIDGRVAGGGSSWLVNGVLGISGTSTLPEFRRRGVQQAVALRAMHDAAREADIATATTAPGSTSQRTFERLGFRIMYVRAILVKA